MKTVKTMKNFFRKVWGTLCLIPVLALTAYADDPTTPGSDFANSAFATGTKRLLDDVGKWLIGIGIAVAGISAVVYLIRRSMADEADGKMFQKRVVTAIICGVAVSLVGGIITLISSYYTA